MENFKIYIDQISQIVELIGVLTIFFGILYSVGIFFLRMNKSNKLSFDMLRQYLGKSILLGLEILIAADIMATVVTDPTLKSVSVLGLIVLIRTVLSFSLQIEIDGKLPWQNDKQSK